MNIEDYREYCLSLGTDVEEKMPFTAFKYACGVLVFYVGFHPSFSRHAKAKASFALVIWLNKNVHGHMFSFFDCDNFSVITLKCQPERIEDLKVQFDCIGNPYNESPKHWIGINPDKATDDLLKELTKNSYEIVKAKYKKR